MISYWDDGIRHTFWVVSDAETLNNIEQAFVARAMSICRGWASPFGSSNTN